MAKNLTAHQRLPDELDRRCDRVLQALKGVPAGERIGVLEQVIDYLRMDETQAPQSLGQIFADLSGAPHANLATGERFEP